MLKKYKNDLFLYSRNKSYDLNNLEIIDSQRKIVNTARNLTIPITTIQTREAKLKFVIENPNGNFDQFHYKYSRFAPDYIMTVWAPLGGNATFGDVLSGFSKWIENHVNIYLNEKNGIDLWAEFKNSDKSLSLSNIDFDDKTNFNFEEKEQVKLGINELKLLIQSEFKTDRDQQNLVIERLDYLIEAVNRLNKFDWKGVAVNSIISISIALTLDPEQGNRLFQLLGKVLSFIPILKLGN